MKHNVRNRPTNRKSKATPKRRAQRLWVEPLEERYMLSATPTPTVPEGTFRPITEVGNNVANPNQGTAGTDFIRLTPAFYANGVNSPSLPNDPSARVISNIVDNQADPADPSQDIQTVNHIAGTNQSLSDFGYSFGQFIDHDIELSQDSGVADNIAVPPGDPIGGPNDSVPLFFNRSQTDPKTGTGPNNPAQDVNSVTQYLDLSTIYGSDQATDNALRTFSGGLLKTGPGGLPPLDNSSNFTPTQLAQINAAVGGMQDDGPLAESQMFAAGDSRANENLELTALQILFLDNHNKIATELSTMDPNDFGFSSWNDENLFQEARKINIADYQSIIYNEYVPAVLGENALPAYTGYNPNIDVGVYNDFGAMAFRGFGHSLVSNQIEREGNNGQELANAAPVPLEEDFFDPNLLNGEGQASTLDPITGLMSTDIGAVLKGDASGTAQAMDVSVINELRNDLFNEVVPGVGFGQDLISLDIQRGRDNGLGSYNQVREALGLGAVTSFSQITSNVTVQQELEKAYDNNVNEVDPIIGGMAENPVAGSDVGQLFQTIMVDQFENLEDGDRFFYLNENWTPAEQQLLNQGDTLTKVIEGNTDITNLQSNVFVFTASISGTVSSAQHGNGSAGNGHGGNGVAGITVELEDTTGDVLATTTTNQQGNYTFNQLSGPAGNPINAPGVSSTGQYDIVLVLPPNLQQVGPGPGTVEITVGGQNVTNVNFTVQAASSSSSSGSNGGSGTSAAAPAVTLAGSSGGVSSSGGALTISSSASSADATQTSTNTSIAIALSNSTGSGTAATPQASTPSGHVSTTSPTNSVSSPTSNQSTAALVAKPAKALPLVEPSSSAAGDTQTVSG
jgi:peroxidase